MTMCVIKKLGWILAAAIVVATTACAPVPQSTTGSVCCTGLGLYRGTGTVSESDPGKLSLTGSFLSGIGTRTIIDPLLPTHGNRRRAVHASKS